MNGGWGCPHEKDGKCRRVLDRDCDPGMKGCVLSGRFVFTTDEKNRTERQKKPNKLEDPKNE